MWKETLEELGLSKNEARVYISLVKLGQTTAWEVSRNTKIHRANVYDALQGLIKKSLVSYQIKEKTKYFEADDPQTILSLLKEKEIKAKKIIPEIKSTIHSKKEKNSLFIFEGISGIKKTTEDILSSLSKGGIVKSFGMPKGTINNVKNFMESYHFMRIKQKIKMQIIYNQYDKERINELNKMLLTEARSLPGISPSTTTIYADKIVFWIWSENPLIVIIKNEKMAKAYSTYFDLLWKNSKK